MPTECLSLKRESIHASFRYSPESRRLNNALFLSALGRCAALTVRPLVMLARVVPRGSESISQYPFNASQVLTEPSQNKFALFAARHLGAKQFKNQRIGSLANSSDGYLGGLGFEARQASTIDKRFRVLAYGRTAKLGNSLAGQAQNDQKG